LPNFKVTSNRQLKSNTWVFSSISHDQSFCTSSKNKRLHSSWMHTGWSQWFLWKQFDLWRHVNWWWEILFWFSTLVDFPTKNTMFSFDCIFVLSCIFLEKWISTISCNQNNKQLTTLYLKCFTDRPLLLFIMSVISFQIDVQYLCRTNCNCLRHLFIVTPCM